MTGEATHLDLTALVAVAEDATVSRTVLQAEGVLPAESER